MRLRCLLSLGLLLDIGAAPVVPAQDVGSAPVARPTTGAIAGTLTDSVHSKPAAGAVVLLTRLSPDPPEFRSALTDDKGRYRFDSLPAGRYSIAFATAYLDSLTITIPPREVDLAEGRAERVDFATPSGATLRAIACPGISLERDHGAVVGYVSDADTDRPLAGARVVVSWNELAVDSATFKPFTTTRGGIVPVDSLGHYRLCGVPTDTYLMMQVQDSGRAGSVLTLTVDRAGGVLVRDLSLSLASSSSIASLDSAAASVAVNPFRDTAVTGRLTGNALLTGVVRGSEGHPLAWAQVRVRGADGVAFTDSVGRFTLTGLPAGSQLLDVRHVGYLLGQVPVELRGGRTVDVAVTLRRIVILDSVRVIARRTRYEDFERRRKEGFGRFLDEKQLEQLHPLSVSDLFRDGRLPGFEFQGPRLFTTHGKFDLSGMGPCDVNVVIDGIFEHQDVDLVDPSNIAAIEAYPGPAGAPIQYDRACGVVVIWTKH